MFLSVSIPVSYAGSGEFSGIWLMTRDHILNGILDPTKKKDEVELAIRLNSHHNKFIGEYAEINNDAVFTGETYTARGTTLIVFFQYVQTFYVIHNGHKVGHNRYVGTWFGAGYLAGDFELRKNKINMLMMNHPTSTSSVLPNLTMPAQPVRKGRFGSVADFLKNFLNNCLVSAGVVHDYPAIRQVNGQNSHWWVVFKEMNG